MDSSHRIDRSALLPGAWCLVLALLLPPAAWSNEAPFPLEPPDTSSPRATLKSFMDATARGVAAYRAGAPANEILPWFGRAERCLDLRSVSPDRVRSVATEAGLLLYEVLNRAGLPDFADIPDAGQLEGRDPATWTVPGTEIAIGRIEEGPRAGEFLFTANTVARALEFYERVKHLPNTTEYPPGSYEDYIGRPDFRLPYLWADRLPAWAQATVLRNPVWKWAVLLLVLAAAGAAALAVHRLRRRVDTRLAGEAKSAPVGPVLFAISLVVIPLIVRATLSDLLGLRFEVNAVAAKLLFAASFVGGIVLIFALLAYLAESLILLRRVRDRSVNAHLIRVSARMVAIVLSIFLFVYATEFLGFALAPVLAGLGIGGLAVALAARPTLENIIGGFTLFADKPVRVGDFCRFGEQEGTVEEIGMRSTRVRGLDDTLVTVPNADFSQMQIRNFGRIRNRLYRTTLGLRYETTPDQLRHVIACLREMLIGHPRVAPTKLHVRFVGFGAYSLDLELFAYIRTAAWLEYRAVREDINLRIMDIVQASGTGFAFPSQTAYLARDGGLDPERTREAEGQTAAWRAEGRMPFPEFDPDQRRALEDSLDYPEPGSPEHRSRQENSGER